MKPGIRRIEILGQNDEHLIVHPEELVNRGVYLEEDGVSGIYDSPEKQTWKQGARQNKSKQKSRKALARDMDLGFLVTDTTGHTYEENESYLIQAIGYELDKYDDDAKYARLAVTTDLSGTRYLDVLQYEEPDFAPKIDSIKQQLGKPLLKIRSGNPDWYEPDVITSCTFTESGWGDIEIENPTNREMMHKWICTLGTWTIPDPSWRGSKGNRYPGGPDGDRTVTSPEITVQDGGLTIDLDPDELMARSAYGTNILARFGGQAFLHKIPPYTQKQTLRVFVDDVPEGGAMIQLVQPRLWTRPWGLERIA